MPPKALAHIGCLAHVETIGIGFAAKHVHQIAIGHALPVSKDRAVRLRSLRELRRDILRWSVTRWSVATYAAAPLRPAEPKLAQGASEGWLGGRETPGTFGVLWPPVAAVG